MTGGQGADSDPAVLSGRPIGIVGLGAMGAAMAGRLAEAGARLSVYNRTRQRAEAFAAATATTIAATPADAAHGADTVLVSVSGDPELENVVRGENGIYAAASAPRVVINAGTATPGTVRALAACGPLIDVGVIGNRDHAAHGELRLFAGGAPALVNHARPVLNQLAKQVQHVGDSGAGMALKLVMNLMMGVEMQALAEAIAAGEAAGLSRAGVLEAITGSGFAAPVMKFKSRRMASRSYQDPDFRLALMAKDLTYVTAVAADAGISLPMTEAAARCHREITSSGRGDLDCAAIAEAYEPGTG